MSFWALLIFSALSIFIFRILPFFFAKSAFLSNQDGVFYRFLTYSTQAMLGAIVYATAFLGKDIGMFVSGFALIDVVKLALLAFVFVATAITNRLLSAFLLSLVVFVGFVLWYMPIS
ncbi:hypothetical protein B6S12_07240 [Helicobacter valdiviensis]|uniref:Branched-chain amino acid ABC transporter n=1 Tax=Helicobacter valdiviensis TaxID=1458358 RepID=A0A2W6MTD1_9HELI|nr:branched-chain amino acid ABC transporter [Helicobacter valdiviensis]PZT47794.1 hypothetical protein B6S12_07240 [Helicobacter valdiviensis]